MQVWRLMVKYKIYFVDIEVAYFVPSMDSLRRLQSVTTQITHIQNEFFQAKLSCISRSGRLQSAQKDSGTSTTVDPVFILNKAHHCIITLDNL